MRKNFLLVCLVLVFSLSAVTYLSVMPRTYACKNEDFVVVIDPGHGGVDPGVIGVNSGKKESDLNLYLSKSLYQCFYADGVTAVMTRTADNGLYGSLTQGFKNRDLKRRVEIAKEVNADIFISVHMNKYSDKKRRGAQVFYRAGSSDGKALAKSIQDQLNGLSESTRECSPLAGDYYVLNNSDCPAVIVECGFLSNAEDEKLLLSEEYRQKVAHSIFYGVVNYLNDKK